MSAFLLIPVAAVVASLFIFFLREIFRIWFTSSQEIDITLRLFKLDFRYICDINTRPSLKMAPVIEEKEDSESWSISKPFLKYKNVVQCVQSIFHILSIFIAFFVPVIILKRYAYLFEGLHGLLIWSFPLVFGLGVLVIVIITDYIIEWLEGLEIMYRANVTVNLDLTRSVRYTLKYNDKIGFVYNTDKIESPPSTPLLNENPEKTTNEEKKEIIYNHILKKQWERLENFYHAKKAYRKYIKLDHNDFNATTSPLLTETINRLRRIGYDVIIKDESVFLKFNGNEELRSFYVINQWNAIVTDYLVKSPRLCTDIECHTLDDEHPLFEENITRLTESGFRVTYTQDEKSKEDSLLRLTYVYRHEPK